MVMATAACMFALKYELARIGIRTDTNIGWWPPTRWQATIAWRSIPRTGHTARLRWWGVMMWIYLACSVAILPIQAWLVVKSFLR